MPGGSFYPGGGGGGGAFYPPTPGLFYKPGVTNMEYKPGFKLASAWSQIRAQVVPAWVKAAAMHMEDC